MSESETIVRDTEAWVFGQRTYRDGDDLDRVESLLSVITRLARELREQVQATLAERAAGDKHANDALRYAGEALELRAEVARLREDAERWRAVRYRMTTETVFIGTEHTRFSACYTGRHESLEALADRIRAAQEVRDG